MKLVIPKQHGAWAMLVIPFIKCHTWETYYLSYSIVFSVVLYLFSHVPISYVHKAKTKKRVFTSYHCLFYYCVPIWDDFFII